MAGRLSQCAEIQERAAESLRVKVMLGAMAIGVGSSFIASHLGLGWVSAAVIVGLVFAYFLVYLAFTRDPLIGRILLMGTVAGVVELLADWWLVDSTHTLVYSAGPLILRSPVYMPLAWAEVIMPLTFWGYWGTQRAALPTVITGIAMFGAVYVPLYENFAFGADWWRYELTPMISYAPWYIILGEGLIAAPLPWFAIRLARTRLPVVVLFGVIEGLWIWAAYAIAFALVG